jgi:hypothetical protein
MRYFIPPFLIHSPGERDFSKDMEYIENAPSILFPLVFSLGERRLFSAHDVHYEIGPVAFENREWEDSASNL